MCPERIKENHRGKQRTDDKKNWEKLSIDLTLSEINQHSEELERKFKNRGAGAFIFVMQDKKKKTATL